MTAPLYFEDLSVGQTFGTGTVTVEPETLKAFAAEFDPQPFHLDEDAARASFFGGLVASGWHNRGHFDISQSADPSTPCHAE